MKQFFKMFFASMLGVIVASVVMVGVGTGIVVSVMSGLKSSRPAGQAPVEASILVLKTDQQYHELGAENSIASFSGESSYEPGLYDVLAALKRAKNDDKIKAVLLRLEGGANGWASMMQLRQALLDFKQSGKKVFAYGNSISQRDYYLASAADVLYLNPSGVLELKGLVSQLSFFKGTLDKLGIEPEIFYAGKFKSATEPFRETKMTDANRIQLTELQRGIWNQFLEAAAEKAHADTADIYRLAREGGYYFAAQAVKNKLVDGAKYWDELEGQLRPLVSKKTDEKVPYVSMARYAQPAAGDGSEEARIALLYAEGTIVDGTAQDYQIGADELVSEIRKIARDEKIKAVVLRINSPGGSALASEIIWRELELLKAKKPLIVSMGDVAASGGYYIATAADSIFALPSTITGSIGVFGMMFNVGDALNSKLGVTFDEVKNAPYADFPTAMRRMTPDEKQRMQSFVDSTYATFKGRVVAGRHLNPAFVDSIAQGRVWTGEDALSLGLVDAPGGIDRALQAAAGKARIKSYRLETFPEPVDRFRSLLKQLGKGPFSQTMIQEAISKQVQESLPAYKQVQQVLRINGRVQMLLPMVPEFY
ncbi:MAG: signal peptide peptidase SppA [Bacteroidetes bacterium]|nr:signal peptide peptidase SppA [Bacteroidota bacterium]MBS1629831.1 signal peptide peptidase SppA [Bacteroidota bacterium]